MKYIGAILAIMLCTDAVAQDRLDRRREPEDYDRYERPKTCKTEAITTPVPIGGLCSKLSPLVYVCYVRRCR